MKKFGAFCLVSMVGSTASGVAAGLEASNSPVLALVDNGSVVALSPETEDRLATQLVAYFKTCLTYETVTGEEPEQERLRRTWEQQRRGVHVIMELPASNRGGSTEASKDVLVGLVGSGAWPVLSRDRGGRIVLYSKCNGLDGLLLQCDIQEVLPAGETPADCGRLRKVERQSGASSSRARLSGAEGRRR